MSRGHCSGVNQARPRTPRSDVPALAVDFVDGFRRPPELPVNLLFFID
jgi:hypothetical protein